MLRCGVQYDEYLIGRKEEKLRIPQNNATPAAHSPPRVPTAMSRTRELLWSTWARWFTLGG
jgi:hypothetical protein